MIQLRILQLIPEHLTYLEMAERMGVVQSLVQYHVNALLAQGYISKKPRKARSLYLTNTGKQALSGYQIR